MPGGLTGASCVIVESRRLFRVGPCGVAKRFRAVAVIQQRRLVKAIPAGKGRISPILLRIKGLPLGVVQLKPIIVLNAESQLILGHIEVIPQMN